MILPALTAAMATPAVLAAVPGKVRPFGIALPGPATVYPYGVYRIISGQPENTLAHRPKADIVHVQIDVYGLDTGSVETGANAIRDALELISYMTDFGDTDRDPDTNNYHFRMDFDFWNLRG